MASGVARRLLEKVKPGIEPAQSYEKNPLGLSPMFLHSLRLTWTAGLLADAVVLLRARVVMTLPPTALPGYELTPRQLSFGLE